MANKLILLSGKRGKGRVLIYAIPKTSEAEEEAVRLATIACKCNVARIDRTPSKSPETEDQLRLTFDNVTDFDAMIESYV